MKQVLQVGTRVQVLSTWSAMRGMEGTVVRILPTLHMPVQVRLPNGDEVRFGPAELEIIGQPPRPPLMDPSRLDVFE